MSKKKPVPEPDPFTIDEEGITYFKGQYISRERLAVAANRMYHKLREFGIEKFHLSNKQ